MEMSKLLVKLIQVLQHISGNVAQKVASQSEKMWTHWMFWSALFLSSTELWKFKKLLSTVEIISFTEIENLIVNTFLWIMNKKCFEFWMCLTLLNHLGLRLGLILGIMPTETFIKVRIIMLPMKRKIWIWY